MAGIKKNTNFLLQEGLARLFCLVSFDIITLELWTEIAPR
jgi:hypothetical protein